MQVRRAGFHYGVVAMLLAATAVPALAAPPSALVRCDGYGGRRGAAENLARAAVILGSLGLFGSSEADSPSSRETGEKAIAACTEAMADVRVSGNPIRRAEVLLARGIANYGVAKYDAALADAGAVENIELPAEVRAEWPRTLGLSARMLRARVAVARGDQPAAEMLATEVAAIRPYATVLNEEALNVLALSPAISPREDALLALQVRLDPGFARQRAAIREAAGDWAGAAADLATLTALLEDGSPLFEARAAADLALAGNAAAAEAAITAVQPRIDNLAANATGTDEKAQTAAQTVARADELVQLARAQLALAAGRGDDAKIILGGRGRWLAPAAIVAAVVGNAQARLGKGGPGSLALDPERLRSDAITAARTRLTEAKAATTMLMVWPHWENPAIRADIGRDVAPGSTAVKTVTSNDGAATLVTLARRGYVGTISEGGLLAAARAAAARGKTEFAVVGVGLGLSLGREGINSQSQTRRMIVAGDKAWASQAGRALQVATVEKDLAGLFPLPTPEVKR